MAMKRTKEPWMKTDDFGRSLPTGIGVNLLAPDIAPLEAFCRDVLGARIVYADEDFAAVDLGGSMMMLHADHSYLDHEMTATIVDAPLRGAGVEIRVYGLDPDECEARARAADATILAASADKPHGLRECHIVAPDGYVFVPSRAIYG